MNLRKQISSNLIVNILSFVILFIIGIWLTPYLLEHLGLIAYGFVPFAMFLSQYVSVLLNSINTSIGKFLLESIHKKDHSNTNKIFSTSLIIVISFIVIQSLIMSVLLFNINYFFSIPKTLTNDVINLFLLTFIGFSISIFRGLYNSSLFSFNRLDIIRSIDILQYISRLIIIVCLFLFYDVSLTSIGIANFVSAILTMIPTLYYFKKYTPEIKFSILDFDKSKVKEISKMSLWISINQIGVLLLGNIDLYFVNLLLDSKATGDYAIIVQIITIFKSIATLFAGLITPIIMKYYANSEFEKIKNTLIITNKFLSIFTGVMIGIILVFTSNLIFIWLGDEYTYLSKLISLSLLMLLFSIPTMHLFSVNIATNNVKLPAIIVIILGVINIILIFIFLKYTTYNLWAVITIKLFLEILFNSIFMPIYISRITKINILIFLKVPLMTIVITSIVYISLKYFNNYLLLESFLSILGFSVVMFCIFVILLSIIIYSNNEKTIILPNLKKYYNKGTQ